MDVTTLEIFAETVRAGSFAEVARRRDVDPSSISRAVATLEHEIGFRLFQRTTRRLSLTEAGEAYFACIDPVIDDLNAAAASALDMVTAPTGVLRITTSVSFGQKVLAPLLQEFRNRFPDLRLQLELSDATLDLVAERIDLAVRLGPRPDSELIGTRLMSTRYRVCASPDYLERATQLSSPEGLAAHDCLRFPLPGFKTTWHFRKSGSKNIRVDIDGSIIISNAMALAQCARQGMGPALLADWLVRDDIATGALLDLFPEWQVTATDFETAVWLLYPSRSYLPNKVRVFIDFLRQNLADTEPAI